MCIVIFPEKIVEINLYYSVFLIAFEDSDGYAYAVVMVYMVVSCFQTSAAFLSHIAFVLTGAHHFFIFSCVRFNRIGQERPPKKSDKLFDSPYEFCHSNIVFKISRPPGRCLDTKA